MPIFMRITKNGLAVINGDATAKGHERWIELKSVQIGQMRPTATKRSEIVVTKSQDSSSADIFNRSLYGEGLTVQIDLMKPGKKSPYLTYTLQDTHFSGFFPGNHSSDERVTLDFAKMTYDTHDAAPDVSRHSEVIMKGSSGNPGTRCIR
jgi:type VI protein secretion system component Hcp